MIHCWVWSFQVRLLFGGQGVKMWIYNPSGEMSWVTKQIWWWIVSNRDFSSYLTAYVLGQALAWSISCRDLTQVQLCVKSIVKLSNIPINTTFPWDEMGTVAAVLPHCSSTAIRCTLFQVLPLDAHCSSTDIRCIIARCPSISTHMAGLLTQPWT